MTEELVFSIRHSTRLWVLVGIFMGIPASLLAFWWAPEASGDELAIAASVPIVLTFVCFRLLDAFIPPPSTEQLAQVRVMRQQVAWIFPVIGTMGMLMMLSAVTMPAAWLVYRAFGVRWAADATLIIAPIVFFVGTTLFLACGVAMKSVITRKDNPVSSVSGFARPIFVTLSAVSGLFR